jgi:hypothetical protein
MTLRARKPGEKALLSEAGFCRRCGAHVSQLFAQRLAPDLHRCELGSAQWLVDVLSGKYGGGR